MLRWLHVGAWGMLGLALVDLFFRFSDGTLEPETFFNADALYLPALYRDLVELDGTWSSWRLTPAPYFFPDMPLYFAAETLSGSITRAVLVFAAAQLVLLALATQWLVRTVVPPGAAALGRVVAVCVVAGLVVAYGTGSFYVMVFPVLSGYHFGVVAGGATPSRWPGG